MFVLLKETPWNEMKSYYKEVGGGWAADRAKVFWFKLCHKIPRTERHETMICIKHWFWQYQYQFFFTAKWSVQMEQD
jgi:hypothetical protein